MNKESKGRKSLESRPRPLMRQASLRVIGYPAGERLVYSQRTLRSSHRLYFSAGRIVILSGLVFPKASGLYMSETREPLSQKSPSATALAR